MLDYCRRIFFLNVSQRQVFPISGFLTERGRYAQNGARGLSEPLRAVLRKRRGEDRRKFGPGLRGGRLRAWPTSRLSSDDSKQAFLFQDVAQDLQQGRLGLLIQRWPPDAERLPRYLLERANGGGVPRRRVHYGGWWRRKRLARPTE